VVALEIINISRYFTCGTTDIMIGGADTVGAISHNEIGWRGNELQDKRKIIQKRGVLLQYDHMICGQ
jgi:hypothetical protein